MKTDKIAAQHTPGPWTLEESRGGGNYDLMAPKSATWIATLHGGYSHHDTEDDGSADADARLIAAAPELLAALEHLSSVLPADTGHKLFPHSTYDIGNVNAALSLAKAAILRATTGGK